MTEIATVVIDNLTPGLAARLSALTSSGANQFDPVRFRYIESMVQRAAQQPKNIGHLLESKVLAALTDYQSSFAQAQADATAVIAEIQTRFPDDHARAQALFEACQFKGLTRLRARLERASKPDALVELGNLLMQDRPAGGDSQQQACFDDIVKQQELDIVNSLSPHQEDSLGELRSIGGFRKAQAKLNADKLVTRAIAECPDDCGPLNPHMLAIRSLSVMRDISPQYLNRFVTYIDNFLWLEQVE